MDANITIFSYFPMPFQRFFISGASGKTGQEKQSAKSFLKRT